MFCSKKVVQIVNRLAFALRFLRLCGVIALFIYSGFPIKTLGNAKR